MPDVPPVPGNGGLIDAVRQAFAPDGHLARTLDGFELRPGQQAMAEAVASVFDRGGHLLAEAGTGTGKTLAYLIPAILARERVVVSTGTKNLQEQILEKDLPVLRQALGTPFTATCMKGRGNYLCLHRFEAFRAAPTLETPADRVALALLEHWAPTTIVGDRAEVDELPEQVSFWNDVAATTDNCLGAECPRFADCFVTRMRQRAAASDVVIVNHHLLCADAALRHHDFGEVVPETPWLVVDEAHQLEDVVTQYFGVAVSSHRVEDLAREGRRVARGSPSPDAIERAAAHVDTCARGFFADLQWGRAAATTRAAREGLFDERVRLTPDLLDLAGESGLELTGALDALARTAASLPDASEDVRSVGRRAGELGHDLRMLLRAEDPAFVYFLEVRGRTVFLRATPIDVAAIVRSALVDRFRSVVFTSATLAVDASFAYAKARLGVNEAESIRLPSEFDYRSQALLYLPPRMPDPRSPSFGEHAAREVVEILQRTEGRAFVLFTSYATLRDVQARIASRLPYPLMVQGTAPRSLLVDAFRGTPNAVLLATSSFWQGVDVAGEALSCVVVDKLPFASPADPIVQARIEAIAARGGDAFSDYQVPFAILTLLQGLGRLLRTRSDRGVLAVLDPRLRTKGYGRRFLEALPPAPITHRLDDIERFFAAP